MVSSINGLRFCSSQTLSHLLNSSFILGQNLEAFVYQNVRSCCTSTKCFLEDLCKYHFKYIIVHVVCMVNKAASYSTILAPVVVGRRCASHDSAGIFCSGSPAAGWLKLWWNSHLPPIPPLRSSDTACLLADHIRGPRCLRLFTTWSSHDPGGLPPWINISIVIVFHEFAVLLEQFALYNAQLVITGDLNLHLEDPSLPASSEFHTIIDQCGLAQHVAEKRSILVPVIKRAGLDPTDPGNFRPIANVSFISKVIEKIIAYQLVPYLEANNLIPASVWLS